MALDLGKYLAWLKFIATLASNAPVFIAAVLEFFEKIKGFIPNLPDKVEQGGLELTQAIVGHTQAVTEGGEVLTADVLEAEGKVLAICAPESPKHTLAVRDGSRLRELFAFLTVLRELLAGFGIGG